MDIHFKEKVIALFMQQLTELIESYQKNLQDLNDSAANETKSTAGDKHETALAMLQIEQKNARSRLEEANKRKTLLEAAAAIKTAGRVVNGSLVNTNKGYFYIAAALGKVVIEEQVVMAVSPSSPLGAKLLGLHAGDSFQLNANTFVITSVV